MHAWRANISVFELVYLFLTTRSTIIARISLGALLHIVAVSGGGDAELSSDLDNN